MLNGKPVLVMNAPEHDVRILATRHKGLRDLELSGESAVRLHTVTLRFDGKTYVSYKATSNLIR
jgi:hypothetical protein